MLKKGHNLSYIPVVVGGLNQRSPHFAGLAGVWLWNVSRYSEVIRDLKNHNHAIPTSANYGWQETDNELGTGIFQNGGQNCAWDCGNDPSLQITPEGLTVTFWGRLYQFMAGGNFPGLVGKGDSDSTTSGSYVMYLNSSHLNFLDWSGGARADILAGSTTLDLQTTYHFAATWQPGVRTSIYINGVLEATTTSSVPTTLDNPNYNLLLASNQGSGGDKNKYNFRGVVHEARVYHRALSPDEIFQLWNPLTRWDVYLSANRILGYGIGANPFPAGNNGVSRPIMF